MVLKINLKCSLGHQYTQTNFLCKKNLIFLRLLFFHCQFTVFWILYIHASQYMYNISTFKFSNMNWKRFLKILMFSMLLMRFLFIQTEQIWKRKMKAIQFSLNNLSNYLKNCCLTTSFQWDNRNILKSWKTICPSTVWFVQQISVKIIS